MGPLPALLGDLNLASHPVLGLLGQSIHRYAGPIVRVDLGLYSGNVIFAKYQTGACSSTN